MPAAAAVLGLPPDWWKLPPLTSAERWRETAAAILARDAQCRGILILGLDSSDDGFKDAFAAAAVEPLVKGFRRQPLHILDGRRGLVRRPYHRWRGRDTNSGALQSRPCALAPGARRNPPCPGLPGDRTKRPIGVGVRWRWRLIPPFHATEHTARIAAPHSRLANPLSGHSAWPSEAPYFVWRCDRTPIRIMSTESASAESGTSNRTAMSSVPRVFV